MFSRRRSQGLMVVAVALVLAGCEGTDDTTGDGGSAPACATGGGDGTLVVDIEGLPADLTASVSIARPDGMAPIAVSGDQTLTLPAGRYTVTASRRASPASLVRTAYEPRVDAAQPCVAAAQSRRVTVTHSVIVTSAKLWVGNALAASDVLGFAPAALGVTGMPAATIGARTRGSDGFTFDAAGNLWVLGGTTADPPLARFPATVLGSSGVKQPDVTIDSPSFRGGAPGAKVVAFDRTGNLWVSVVFAEKVVRLTPDQLTRTGTPTAGVEFRGIDGPSGIAFDAVGNMFVAAGKKVVRVDQARLAAGGMGADLEIGVRSPPPVIVDLQGAEGLAFDGAGHLWCNFGGTLVRLSPAELTGMGTKTLTPAIQIEMEVTALPRGLAFDEGGGLWVATQKGKFGRYAPEQLLAGGRKNPELTLSSPDVGYAGWFALYPAPAALPLFHAIPAVR